MKIDNGSRNGVARHLALAALAICLSAGAVSACGEKEEPVVSAGGSGPTNTRPATDVGGVTGGSGPSVPEPRSKPADGGKGTGQRSPRSGTVPPSMVESRLAGIAAGLPGRVGMLISGPGGPGPQVLFGEMTAGPALATINLPVAQTVLESDDGPSGASATIRNQINLAIAKSDQDAGAALLGDLGSAQRGPERSIRALNRTLQSSGAPPGVFPQGGGTIRLGMADWPLGGQNRYMAALAGGCSGSAATRKFLLAQMAPAAGRENFGLAKTGSGARWVSGVGTEGSGLVRQMGLVDTGAGPVVVAVMAMPADGSVETGKSMLDEIVTRFESRFEGQSLPPVPCRDGGSPLG